MGSISDYLEDELLDHVLDVGAYTPPTIYVALSTVDPTDDASGIAEPVGNGYARIAHSSWDAAASRLTENTGTVTFPQASGAWGTISHYAIYDALTNGNMLAHGSLSVSKSVVNGNTPSIADGEIEVSFNSGAIGTFAANELLDHVFGNGVYSAPAITVALSTADPTDDGSGLAEPASNNYARPAGGSWDAASGGASENSADISFNSPTGSWGAITHSALMVSGESDLLFYGTATPNQTPNTGDTVKFPSGELDIAIS